MAAPRRPQVLLFAPYPDRARICGNGYIDTPAHTDTEYQIRRYDDDSLIIGATMSTAETNIGVLVALIQGDLYTARIRYKNADGWSGWSDKVVSRVRTDLPFAENNVPAEPLINGTIPIDPSFVATIRRRRAILEHVFETNHVFRRLEHSRERKTSFMNWINLTTSERDSVVNFLKARADAAQAWRTNNDVAHGTDAWFMRRGRVEWSMVDIGTWSVRAEVVQIQSTQLFTVGESAIGGPDPIE